MFCLFYTKPVKSGVNFTLNSTPLFGLTTSQVLNSQMWTVTSTWDSATSSRACYFCF